MAAEWVEVFGEAGCGTTTLAFATLNLDPAAMAGDDAVTDRQSQPRTFTHRLGGEERIEQPFPMFRINAGTVVANGDRDPGTAQAPSTSIRPPSWRPEPSMA